MVGALIWKKGDFLRMALDRADLWDKRSMANREIPEFSFKWVLAQRMKDTDEAYHEVQKLYDDPYLSTPGPTKIPGGILAFDAKKFGIVQGVRLIIKDAICEVNWDSGLTLHTFIHTEKPLGYFRFSGNTENVQPELLAPEYGKSYNPDGVAGFGLGLGSLGYEAGDVINKEHSISYKQVGWKGFEYTIDVCWDKKADGIIEGAWSITSSDAPPISLQAIWTADNGDLPPWKSDLPVKIKRS